MTTKQIIQEMEKEFNEKFKSREGEETAYAQGWILLPDDIKSFISSYIRTLLESFGEEIINRLEEDVKVVIESEVVKEGNVINECISGVFGNERLKVKEILQNIK